MNFTEELFKNQDLGYKDFSAKLIPTINKDIVIGVRTPVIRKIAKENSKDYISGKDTQVSADVKQFLESLPHKYLEENNLHAFIIEQIKDYDRCVEELEKFLPYIDNWATCDSMSPKVFKKNKNKLLEKIHVWIKSDKTYTVRFAIGMLMSYFLDEDFDEKYLQMVADVKSDEFYINMMQAWYFATALAKQYDKTVVYIEEHRLDDFTHKKTIQKSVESFRVSEEHKAYLKSFR